MKKFNIMLEKALSAVCAGLMFLMICDVSWQVFSRFILSDPSSFSEEIARFLLIWIGFLGAAYAFRQYAHLGLDILVAKLGRAQRLQVDRLGDLICFLFAGVILVYGGMKIVFLTLDLNQLSAALQMEMGYVYMVIPVSGILIMLFSVERMIYGRGEPDHSVTLD